MTTEDAPKASNGTTTQHHDSSKSTMTIEDASKVSYGTSTQHPNIAQPSVRSTWKFAGINILAKGLSLVN